MKTAIFVPDSTFDKVERRACALGMSRSEFFTRAAERYLGELDAQSLTARIDAAISLVSGLTAARGRDSLPVSFLPNSSRARLHRIGLLLSRPAFNRLDGSLR
jgi:hypothetical protein